MAAVQDDDDLSRLRRFWNERYRTFALSESGWSGAGERFNHYAYRCKAAALRRALDRLGVTEATRFSVLDAGCGQGFFAGEYRSRFPGASYVGVDLAPHVIAHLQETMPWARFHCDDLSVWKPQDGGKFDIIQSFEVLHLVLDDSLVERAFRNFASLLAPGGTLLVTAVLPPVTEDRGGYLRFRSESVHHAWWRAAGLVERFRVPMYYWLPDRGPSWPMTRPIFFRMPPLALYLSDRIALRLRLPRPSTSSDSRMQLVALQRADD